ncbi:MAG: FKBP-type peptidyl-prolyl cis-trans isomerase [Chloroflexi bacterium]|nr:MAG: FKBP-type peptidyl-prolyl cis-trans isomerase [Chloroflexota bacterium]
MHLGGKRQVVVPPELGFGEAGAGTVIPPNATLLLELELDSFRTPPKPEDIAEADYTTTDSGLQYYNLEEGDGETPEAGDLVSVEYVIWLQDGLTYVGSSEDQGQPFEFALGSGRVFPGWDEAVSTMRVGDKRQLVIPPELGLGEQGGGSVIPPNATLIMQVELVDIRKPAQIMELDDDQYEVTEGGVKYYDIKPGDGPAAESGMTLEVHYTGWLEDGTKFDSSLDAGRTFQFVLGAGMVIPGWDEGLVGMKVGGVRQLVIPSELAYGSTGAGGVIPPDATLIFQVELVSIGQ